MDYRGLFEEAVDALRQEKRYRVFADLERQRLIRREGRRIIFTDWDEMRRVASFQPGYLQ